MKSDQPIVLVVEDEEELRDELLELLAMRGFRVLGAAEIEEAVHLLRAAPAPVWLLSDLRLPGGSGLDLLRQVAGDPALKANVARSMLMTGHTDLTEQVEMEMTRLGVPMLFKPFPAADLLDMLDTPPGTAAHQ